MEKTIEIPEGYEARIEGNKVILEPKESEDERIRNGLLRHFKNKTKPYWNEIAVKDIIAYLERQKENPQTADFIPADCASNAKCENEHNMPGDFVFELRQIISRHRYADLYGECVDDEEGMAREIMALCERQKEQKPAEWMVGKFQQEQPMPDSTQLIEFWNEDKEMLKEKDFRDDSWRLAYNAFMCGFGRGISVKRQEQPETPSGEEVMNMCNQILIDWIKEGKTPEEREQREQAHIRFFELYDEYMQEQPEVDFEKEELVGVAESPLKTFPRVNDFECGGSYRH